MSRIDRSAARSVAEASAVAVPSVVPLESSALSVTVATCAIGVPSPATAPGVWVAVCGPCGDALDAGKPPVGYILDAVATGLRSTMVTEEDATAGVA